MKIKNIEINALIFDLDGTLLDSTSVWHDVDKDFFLARGQVVPLNYNKDIAVMGLNEAAIYTKEKYFPLEDVEDIKKEWLMQVKDRYAHEVYMKDYAKEFLEELVKINIPFAVATANDEECYLPCLVNHGINQYFKYICDTRKFVGGKRNPDIYLHVAKILNSTPDKIMIFEDTLMAIEVAKNAGFKVCAVKDASWSNEDEDKKKLIADIYIEDFKELVDEIRN